METAHAAGTVTNAKHIVDILLECGHTLATLKQNRKTLTDAEREQVKAAGASVWKAVVDGKTWYVCNTHRAFQAKPTLAGAIKAYPAIEATG